MLGRLLRTCHWHRLLLQCVTSAFLSVQGARAYNDSIFSFENSYPNVWWSVSSGDRPTLANNAVRLRSDSYDLPLFARSVIVSLASGQRNEVCLLGQTAPVQGQPTTDHEARR